MKYFLLPFILIITACSLNKNSTYWSKDLIEKSIENKEISKTSKNNTDFKTMTFDDFNTFLKDYSNKTDYPDINN